MNNASKIKLNPLSVLNFATFWQYQRLVMPISFLFYLYNGLRFTDFILCQSLYSAACLVGKIVMGALGDIFSKKKILITAYLLFMLRVILWINFEGFWIILAGELLYGLFKALYRGNVDSYIYEYLESENIPSDMASKYGKLSFYTSLGSAISCFAGVILYRFFGFKTILYAELVFQIIAVTALMFLPDIKIENKKELLNPFEYFKSALNSTKSLFLNFKVNFFVYYSALINGLTSVFVWNFQPLLKVSSAPIIYYGVVNFVNQILRAAGGLFAHNFVRGIKPFRLVNIVYFSVILSFVFLIAGYTLKNYILILLFLMIICLVIFLFVVFNVFSVAKVHEHTQDYNRAATSSVYTFCEDFMSFFLLLNFKFLYDKIGIINSLVVYAIIAAVVMLPVFGKNVCLKHD